MSSKTLIGRLSSGTTGSLVAASLCALLLWPVASMAVTPELAVSSASLNGAYAMQMAKPDQVSWYAQKTCTWGKQSATYWGGGQQTFNKVTHGTLTFDGKGHFNFVGLKEPIFDQNASNATVVIQCPASPSGSPTINNGHAVFDAPAVQQITGTYTVLSNGSGTMTATGQGAPSIELDLAQVNSAGLAMAVNLRGIDKGNYIQLGTAFHK